MLTITQSIIGAMLAMSMFASILHAKALFYGADNRQAFLVFDSRVQIPVEEDLRNYTEEEILKEYQSVIDATIDMQLHYLHGVFTTHDTPTDFVTSPGTPRGGAKISDVKVHVIDDYTFEVAYHHVDIGVFKKERLEPKKLTHHAKIQGRSLKAAPTDFYLPLMPGEDGFLIFAKGCPSGKASPTTGECIGKINRCTDPHYPTHGDFWYFWNPFQTNEDHLQFDEPRACPIKKSDLVEIKGRLVPIASTSEENPSYPDYYALYKKDSKDKPTVRIDFYVGIDESYARDDLGKHTFKKTLDVLIHGADALKSETNPLCLNPDIAYADRPDDCIFTRGEVARLQSEDIPTMDDVTDAVSPYDRTLLHESDKFIVKLRIRLINPNDIYSYTNDVRDSMREADIFIYNGHSGLGTYFDVYSIFPEGEKTPDPRKSQIYVFNGCSTFSYYNHSYFRSRSTAADPFGFAKLDIVTNSIGALFSLGSAQDTSFVQNILRGDEPSWPQIINDMYASEPEESALVHVNGDEVNPRRRKADGKCPQGFSYDKTTEYCEATASLMKRPAPWVDFFD